MLLWWMNSEVKMRVMFEAADIAEFPFASELPKREKTRLEALWEHFAELRAITAEKGMLVPSGLAAKILGVSRQRVFDLIQSGRLEVVEVNGHNFVPESSVIAYARSERKAGRPVKLPETKREAWRVSREFAAGK
jgi:hypothetical protein